MKHPAPLLPAALAAILLATGCAVGNTKQVQQPTVGQELIDLQRARETGAISDREFEEQRQQILNRRR